MKNWSGFKLKELAGGDDGVRTLDLMTARHAVQPTSKMAFEAYGGLSMPKKIMLSQGARIRSPDLLRPSQAVVTERALRNFNRLPIDLNQRPLGYEPNELKVGMTRQGE
jgi:hypothetical protein